MTDIELINRVKETADSTALTELINRHSGMYVKMVQRYAAVERNSAFGSAKLDTHEMADDKAFNMYQYVLSYDPTKNMKFSTYVGEMTRYACLDVLSDKKILSNHSNKVEVTEECPITTEEPLPERAPQDSTLESIRARTRNVTDDRFWRIFDFRHFKDGGGYTWRTIGQHLSITHECARQIYNRNIKHLKYHLIK